LIFKNGRLIFLFRSAYYVLCRDCATAKGVCAKCCTSDREIIPPEPDEIEKLRLELEMKVLIKSLPERKRRTFLRFMKGKKKSINTEDDDEGEEEEQEKPRKKTRQELLEKIDELKKHEDGDEKDVDEGEESYDSDDYSTDSENS
jgi:hypothetical protein